MQQIHINRRKINSIEFEHPEIRVPLKPGGECSFEIALINYGTPTRVHLSTSDSIRDYVAFLQDNPYVTHQEWIPVVVKLPPDISTGEGKIKITTGYGSHTEAIKVYIGVQKVDSKPKPPVDVDTRLAVPRSDRKQPRTKVSKVAASADEKQTAKSFNYEKLIIPVLMVLLIIWIVVITFVIKKIDPLFGALSVSIIIIFLIFYGAIHYVGSIIAKRNEES